MSKVKAREKFLFTHTHPFHIKTSIRKFDHIPFIEHHLRIIYEYIEITTRLPVNIGDELMNRFLLGYIKGEPCDAGETIKMITLLGR